MMLLESSIPTHNGHYKKEFAGVSLLLTWAAEAKVMTIRVVGAGLYRTGTKSLKAALETLLGRPSYHMAEVFVHPEHIPTWQAAATGKMPDWKEFLKDYDATLDAPAAYFWPEISAAFPDAIVWTKTL